MTLWTIHTLPGPNTEAAGPVYSVVRLCEALTEHGLKVILATPEWGSGLIPTQFTKTFPAGIGPKRLGRSPDMLRWLTCQAKSFNVRLIHNHSLWMMPNVYPGLVARKHKIPYVVSPRGTLSRWAMASGSKIKRIFWPIVQRPSLEAVTCWHATAESEYEDIRRLGFRQPVAVVPNGIDVPHLPPKQVSDVRTLLFLNRIHPKKGLDILLSAWRAIQNRYSDWRLAVVGPDNDGYLAKMQKLSNELKLKRVEFLGPLYGHDKWLAYQNADLFVLPTYSENFGITVAESLAAGTPVIVSQGAPWSGLSKHGAGWWTEIGVEPLVAVLEESLSQPREVLGVMGERGRKWMKDDFSWYGVGQIMAATYSWMLEGGPVSPWLRID